MSKLRAAGYCSGGTRAELNKDKSISIDRQKRAVLSYCDDNGHTFKTFYVDKKDPGAHGDERDQLRALMRDAAEGKFNAVVVKRLDRLSTDFFYQLWIEKELMNLGVKVLPVEPGVTKEVPPGMDTLFRRLIEAFSTFEKPQSGNKQTQVKKKKPAQSTHSASRQGASSGLVFGWREIKMKGKVQIVPHQEEQEHLKNLHDLHEKGWSNAQIAELFTEGGFVGDIWYDRVKPPEAEKWDADMVNAALNHDPLMG